MLNGAGNFRLSDSNRYAGNAGTGPHIGNAFLYCRRGRERHDVRQPDLGLGPSRGLYTYPAGFRDLFGSGVHLLAETVIRVCINGGGTDCHNFTII